MTPSVLKNEIAIKAQELTTAITTTDAYKDKPEAIKAAIEAAMLDSVVGAIKTVLTAYGEYTKVSPAYDRVRAVLAEIRST